MTAVQPRGWGKIKDAASYAGVQPRTFRKWFAEGLRYVKAPTGAILVNLEWIDAFLERHVVDDDSGTDQIVNEALEGVLG